jgi:hypothetical protein
MPSRDVHTRCLLWKRLIPKFNGAKFFSKFDAKAGYWGVRLEEESQLFTTFRTPFGRYCFIRLPFGLNISQDVFQQRMDEILEGLEGCICIADDICIVGSTEEEHDQRVIKLMERAKSQGLVFNSTKCAIKKMKVSFFGNVYTPEGIIPDPVKVKDIQQMPKPSSKDELQRFLGMMTYMGSFIPNLSAKSSCLRDLIKKDVPFIWDEQYQHAFDNLKNAITARSLAYYDVYKPLTLEVDASMKGLGACLTQNGKIVACASKTLSKTQANYSNIERETLAVLHGIERFNTYLYGRHFSVISDHKPLEVIFSKPN